MKLLIFPSLEFFELSLDFDEEVFRGFGPLVVTMKFQVTQKPLQHPLPASAILFLKAPGLTISPAMLVSLGLNGLLFRKPSAMCSGH